VKALITIFLHELLGLYAVISRSDCHLSAMDSADRRLRPVVLEVKTFFEVSRSYRILLFDVTQLSYIRQLSSIRLFMTPCV
jgi:hypothetical protein